MITPEILWTSEDLNRYQRHFFTYLKEYLPLYNIIACGYTHTYRCNKKEFNVIMCVKEDTPIKTVIFLENRFYNLLSTCGDANVIVKVVYDRRNFELWNMTLGCKLVYDKEALDALQLEQRRIDLLSKRKPHTDIEC